MAKKKGDKKIPVLTQYRNIYRKTMRKDDICEFLEHRAEFIISEEQQRSCCGWTFTTAKALLNHIKKEHSDIYASYVGRNSERKTEITEERSNSAKQNDGNNMIGNKEIIVSLGSLSFGTNYISRKIGSTIFILFETGISRLLNSEKSIKSISTTILLDHSNQSFRFLDLSLLSNLKDLSALLEKAKETENLQKQVEKFQKRIKKEKKNKTAETAKTKIEHRVLLSNLKFGQGLVSIIYKRRYYYYKDSRIRNYDKTIKQIFGRLSKARKLLFSAIFIYDFISA